MTRILPAVLAATVLAATAANAASAAPSALKNPLSYVAVFYTGCNYWESNAGM